MSERSQITKSFLTEFLALLRVYAKKLRVSGVITITRQLIHFGPWRNVARKLLSTTSDNTYYIQPDSIIPKHHSSQVIHALNTDGLAVLGRLPPNLVQNIRESTDKLGLGEYKLVHQVSDEILRLSQDPALLSLLHTYFNREPELIEASISITGPEKDNPDHNQNKFHFDYAGWQSLNVFVYLTDVTDKSSFHIYVKGSSKKIGFWDVIRQIVPNNEIIERFKEAITPIKGPAGTIFIENAEGFHRRHKGSERRVILNMLYTSHRNILSYGRANKRSLSHRDRSFESVNKVKPTSS